MADLQQAHTQSHTYSITHMCAALKLEYLPSYQHTHSDTYASAHTHADSYA
jgi:hypothetical protein